MATGDADKLSGQSWPIAETVDKNLVLAHELLKALW